MLLDLFELDDLLIICAAMASMVIDNHAMQANLSLAQWERAQELWEQLITELDTRNAQGMEAGTGETAFAGSTAEGGDSPTPQRGDAP